MEVSIIPPLDKETSVFMCVCLTDTISDPCGLGEGGLQDTAVCTLSKLLKAAKKKRNKPRRGKGRGKKRHLDVKVSMEACESREICFGLLAGGSLSRDS